MFLLAASNEYLSLRQARQSDLIAIPWNKFNRFRLLITVVLILLKLTEAIDYCYHILISRWIPMEEAHVSSTLKSTSGKLDTANSPNGDNLLVISALLAPIIEVVSYSVLVVLYCLQRKVGRHTSGSIWFYLFMAVLCSLIDFYSLIVSAEPAHLDYVLLVVRYNHFPLLFLLFVFECLGDSPILKPDSSDVRPESPELAASYFSSITFWWFNGFLLLGYRTKLELQNLWKTLSRDKAGDLVPILRNNWYRKSSSSSSLDKKKKAMYQTASGTMVPCNSLGWVLAKLFWAKLLFAASLKLMQDSLQFVTPLILKKLLAFMSSSSEIEWHGTLFAMLLLIIPTLQSIILGNYFYHMQIIGIQVRTMIIGSVYRKALLLSGSARMDSTSGEIVNLMAVDSQRFQDLLMYLNLIWSAPFQIILAVLLLYRELGWSVFAGVACMCLVLPCNAYIASRIKVSQIKVMKKKDERVKQMNEILSGIKVIKLYAWENSFIANLFSFRNKELAYLRRILTLDALQTFFWQCSPFAVALVSFAVYVNADDANVLTAEKAFVSISLFNLLRFPLTMLPSLVTSLVLTVVSSRRVNKFLNSNEIVKYVSRNEELAAISIEGGTLSWSAAKIVDQDGKQESNSSSSNSSVPVLKDIDFQVAPGKFVAIIGQVASGKSSLLASILGELHRISGRFNVCKSMDMAYVPQQAWIQNMTVRDNILFGATYNEQRYKQVLSVCCLQSDLDTLPGGDQAEIGEKGINLSGGQKQRVSLARACYSNSDIFLLDDPLSALDSHVAKHVFDKVLSSSTGLLRGKTRVLATNSLFVLPYVDQVVVLDEGRIVESGTYKELMAIEGGHLAETMRQYSGNQENSRDNQQESIEDRISLNDEQKSLEHSIQLNEEKIMKSSATPVLADVGKLIDIEKLETGSVNYSVYLQYFKAISLTWLAFVSISLVASSAFNVGTNLWLSVWSSDSDDPNKAHDTNLRTMRLIVYASLGGLQCFSILSGSFGLSRGAVRASKRLHVNLLEGVMHSPMAFFDTTPIGRVVNRFAKDIDVIDSTIPGSFRSWLNCLLQVASTMFVICYSFPTFFIIIVPLGIIYYLIQRIFIVTTRQLKRLESITRSPIYSHFNETLSGISTIRAYDCVDRFVNHSDNLVDRNQSCSYPNIIANRWLSLRLEFFGNLITAAAALFSVYYRGVVGAGVAGLTISYSMSITQTLSWLVRMTSDLETNIVSVERILEYTRNKQEDLWVKSDRPKPDWPDKGTITIEHYSTRYRDDTDLVLRDLDITIKAREKLGIVGRTGSGKSSLSLSLFRILEPVSGRIIIDGLDVSKYGLHDLRSKLTIIPQDPVLFSGTLRFNLDPLQLYTDTDIWRALELAHLKSHINALQAGLDYKVSEFGENFSVGQRQLICLARAILRKSKILILDEATASVDLETDSIVQRTIRDVFADCTIITIAHRLHTILDSDRILVLDKGSVLELNTPSKLIADVQSSFSSLIRDAGIDRESFLRAAATTTTTSAVENVSAR